MVVGGASRSSSDGAGVQLEEVKASSGWSCTCGSRSTKGFFQPVVVHREGPSPAVGQKNYVVDWG